MRFDECFSSRTHLKFVTDGILLKEAVQDPLLRKYHVIIIDEAHERSIDTDILLAIVKKAVTIRKDLRVVVTSATLDTSLFTNYFHEAPLLEIEGRKYDVEVLHGASKADQRVESSVNAVIRIHLHEGPGDILIFLTGSEEVEKACNLCLDKLGHLLDSGKEVPSMLILPLYGAMSGEDQSRVFQPAPPDTRKVIFSTNIAETSLTIDGIGFVIDCGYVKQKRFNPRTGLDALMTLPISRQQAKQRTGRAGRTQEGKCYRLYPESFFNDQMEESTVPELLRVNLHSSVLTLKALDIHDVVNFDFISPPPYDSIVSALRLLYLIEALDLDGKITSLGRELVKLPLDPSFARSLIASFVLNVRNSMLTLVAMLSTEKVWRHVPKVQEEECQEAHEMQSKFWSRAGDHVTYVKAYEEWSNARYSQDWCLEHFINARAMRHARDIRDQLYEMVSRIKLPDNLVEHAFVKEYPEVHANSDSRRLRIALCFGFFMNTARGVAYGQPGSYLSVVDGSVLHLDRGSVLSLLEVFPTWLIYTSLAGKTLIFGSMKDASKIKNEWVTNLVPRLSTVDIPRLIGQPTKPPREVSPVRKAVVAEDRLTKIEQARMRYLERTSK